jgi:protein involved in polysaccharide export with SLBB domain/capsular polysaccharide biosynthesis protein
LQMNDYTDPESGALRRRDEISQDEYHRGQRPAGGVHRAEAERNHTGKVDAWTFIDLLLRKWYWPVLFGMLFAAGFFYLGSKVIREKFTAQAQLLRYETPMSDYFKTPPITVETFASVIRAPDLLRKVADRGQKEHGIPPLPPEKMTKIIKIEPEVDSDIVKVFLAEPTKDGAVNLLNIFIEEAVRFTKELQQQQASQLAQDYLKEQVARMEKDIEALHREFRNMPAAPLLTNQLDEVSRNLQAVTGTVAPTGMQAFQVADQARRLQQSISELNDLLVRFTDMHPQVVAKKEEVAVLERRLAEASTNKAALPVASSPIAAALMSSQFATRPGEAPFNPELDIVRTKLLSLEQGRVDLANRYHEAALFARNPPGVVKIFAPADPKTTQSNMRWVKVGIVGVFGGVVGVLFSIALVLLIEFADRRLKTVDDLRRVTRLPVLTSLGDVHRMSPEERSKWAFRTWTLLQGRLSPSANHGLVCGITSSTKGEGRSTWIRLLADAASLTGFRVLTIATRPSPANGGPEEKGTQKAAEEKGPTEEREMKQPTGRAVATNRSAPHANGTSSALTSSVLTSPMQVTEQFTGPNSQPMVHIPLPGWVWNLERRKQWGEALSHWRQIDNLVILVELPPASVPEAVLLGSNLPNMVWLAHSGKADAAETRAQIQTLRDARCNLVGAVLNRERSKSVKNRFARWMPMAAIFIGLCLAAPALAQDPAAAGSSAAQNGSFAETPETAPAAQGAAEDALTSGSGRGNFSIVHPSQKAVWQQNLTLGPGDVLTLGLFGAPELGKAEVAIGPDGRISYLEAHDIMAAGLTIDQLRERLDEDIGKFRRAARTMVTPVTFKSKKYFILGKVMTKGVYTLDRPMTVLEAIARAKGLENGLVDRNIIEVADVSGAFLARRGKRIPLNFEKLFQEGDLSQNIAIEPNDYIYFPPADVQEVYVVGEVRSPGAVVYNSNMTIMGAIAGRGGYTDRSFKMRVLVVRGPASKPEPIIVDTHAILDGKSPDFKVKPKDLIYVNSRPFIRIEELSDAAATAFLQSLITSWVGVDVLSPIAD